MDIKEMKQLIESQQEEILNLEHNISTLEDEVDDIKTDYDALLDEYEDLKELSNQQSLYITLKDKPTLKDQYTLEYVQRNWEELKAMVS